jgi:hypothetical protein
LVETSVVGVVGVVVPEARRRTLFVSLLTC